MSQYLSGILAKYAVGTAHVNQLRAALIPSILKWANGHLVSMDLSGSIMKGTAVRTGTDTDFFLSLKSTTPATLKQIYDTLFAALQQSGFSPVRQNVSIGVAVNGHRVDIVPGRRHEAQGSDHSLHVSKRKTWVQTNVNTHVNHVAGSGRTNEIRLTKIWRDLWGLQFPSFYLELVVIDALTGCTHGQLASNFWEVLRFLCQDFTGRVYYDPANTNNCISDDLTVQERQAIATAACRARASGL